MTEGMPHGSLEWGVIDMPERLSSREIRHGYGGTGDYLSRADRSTC